MDLSQDIKSVTYMKTKPAELIAAVNKNRRPVVITQNGEARAVVQDIASYEQTKKALLLLKLIAQGEQDIAQNKTSKQSAVFSRIEKRIKTREKSRSI